MTVESILSVSGGITGLLAFGGGCVLYVWKGGETKKAFEGRMDGFGIKLDHIAEELGHVAHEIGLLRETKEAQGERIAKAESRIDENTRRLDRIKAP